MPDIEASFRELADRLAAENEGLIISTEQDRYAIAAMRSYLLPVLRRRQSDVCWFCEKPLPKTNTSVDAHHVIPLHIAFPDGYGRPSTASDLRVVHRKCHKRKPAGVR